MEKIKEINKAKINREDERGVSLIVTLVVMTLLLGFVALTLSRTSSEAQVSYNDAAEARTLAASEAGLEDATRDFANILENKLNPTSDDLTKIKDSKVDGFEGTFDITKTLKPIGKSVIKTLTGGSYQGLYSLRDEWQINVDAQEKNSDVKVETMRRFYNNRIPIFQFGAFYQDDLELNRPPLFVFSGKVHTNSNLFVSSSALSGGGGIFFKSKVTVAGEIVNDIWKTGTTLHSTGDTGDVFFPNASGVNQKLSIGSGSVTCNSNTGNTILQDTMGTGRIPTFPYPNCAKNAGWNTFAKRFDGNLVANASQLKLPVDRLNIPLIEIMRRGQNVGDKANIDDSVVAVTASKQDNGTVSKERYANKQGLRISLANSQQELPGCAAASAGCGIQLDDSLGSSLGYRPKGMTGLGADYKTTALNGNRLAVGSAQRVWIKVETVDFDFDREVPITADITEDFLSLGVTEPFYTDRYGSNEAVSPRFQIADYVNTRNGDKFTGQDSRSVIKLQRFYMDGQNLPTGYLTNKEVGGTKYNYVPRTTIAVNGNSQCAAALSLNQTAGCGVSPAKSFAAPLGGSVSSNETEHYRVMNVPSDSTVQQIVPFPIQIYDSREGNRRDSNPNIGGDVYSNGVMSLVDIDVANLRRFFAGEFDGQFRNGLRSTNIPSNHGWVVYFSDRRGDKNFDGRYDMEDVNPNSSSLIEEDLNNDGRINFSDEAPTSDERVDSGLSSVTDHKYYRRGARLINARLLPGRYDSITPANTVGFTFASENGVYVGGDYNVQGITVAGGTNVTESTAYSPRDTADHIPSSIVGDSVTILSNDWNDSNSFVNAFDVTKRLAKDTKVRFAMISGDSLTARAPGTNGNFEGLNGGLHNLLRFLERWKDKRLNYSGSLINLYNSFNNNGKWKCCTTVYDPPIRDWTFDNTFSDPNRLPPGSPFVYYISLTGFERVSQ